MPRFALALSGGGAAGLGHIPVIEGLDAGGHRPVAVAGTSMGALLGACVAAGMTAQEIRTLVLGHLDNLAWTGAAILRGASWSDLGLGLFLDPGRILDAVLPDAIPETFEELELPFTAVATDFHGQCEVRFTSGPLRPALAASMAIPGLFRPVVIDGVVYVDGGVCNNLPISALPEGVPVLAVDAFTTRMEQDDKSAVLGTLATSMAAMRTMMRALLEYQLAAHPPFALLEPESCRYGPLEFVKAREILAAADPIRDEVAQVMARLPQDPPPMRIGG